MDISEVIKKMEEAISRTSCVWPKETPEILEAIKKMQTDNLQWEHCYNQRDSQLTLMLDKYKKLKADIKDEIAEEILKVVNNVTIMPYSEGMKPFVQSVLFPKDICSILDNLKGRA